jgi:hypothetical protein
MDLRGWIPPEAWAILIMGTLIGGWVVWQIVSFTARHLTVGWQ